MTPSESRENHTTDHHARSRLQALDAFVERNPGIEEIDLFIFDINGHAVGKRLPLEDARSAFERGLTFSACAPLFDCRGRGQNPLGIGGSDGDPDAVVMPIGETLSTVPWAQSPTAQALCSMYSVEATGEPMWFDARTILKNVLGKCLARGIRPVVACELEFYLVDGQRDSSGRLQPARTRRTGFRPGKSSNLSLEDVEDGSWLFAQIQQAALAQSIPLCATVAEYGLSQYELNLRHVADPVLAADHAALLRRLVRGVARSAGQDATFMAKPFRGQPGNGLHVHVSIANEDGVNVFGQSGGERLLMQSIAGMQALMAESMALFAPSFNSFRRYRGQFVPNAPTWGRNNRSVAFRVPLGNAASRRVEHRVAGADASPHLVVAAVLAAILHGIQNGLEPSQETVMKYQGGMSVDFPTGVEDALLRLERCSGLTEYIPREFLRAYAHVKRGEFECLFEDVTCEEVSFYG